MSTPRSAMRNRLELAAYRVARGLAGRGGPWLQERLGTILGGIFHRAAASRRAILAFNVGLAFPELNPQEKADFGLRVARHFGRTLLASFRLQRMTPEILSRHVEISGGDHLDRAIRSGAGFFILSGHLGAWEVAALRAGMEIPGGMAIIQRPLDNPLLDRELEHFRNRFGNSVRSKRGAVRHMLMEIRVGRAVGILIDQRANHPGALEVPFFGHPARTHSVLAGIVLRTGAVVLPIWALAEGSGRYRLIIEEPVEAGAGDDEESLTARYTEVTERAIRRRPEQWLWYHDRWREIRLSRAAGDSAR